MAAPAKNQTSSPSFESFIKTLDGLMRERGLNDNKLTKAAKLSHGYINRLRHERRVPKTPTLQKIGDALDVPWQELLDPGTASVAVPIYDVRAAAGDGAIIAEEQNSGVLNFDNSFLRMITDAPAENLAIIRVWGDSMEPAIPEDALALIDCGARTIINRGIYAFRHGDDARVKRILIHPTTGALTLRSDNDAWEDMEVDEPEALDVIGRVIWFGKVMV